MKSLPLKSSLAKTHLNIIILSIAIFFLSFSIYLIKHDYTSGAYFGGDTWEYQSIGVNLSKGKGYLSGGALPFESYQFESSGSIKNDVRLYNHFKSNVNFSFNRTPGYPLFLGIVYKIFGVKPILVKILQTTMLSLCASSFIFLGYYFWNRIGIYCGALSSIIFVLFYSVNPTDLLVEPLLIFLNAILAIVLSIYHNYKNAGKPILIGVITGLVILLKPYIGLPLVIAIYFLFYNKKEGKNIKKCLIFIIFFSLTILPWSICLSGQTKKISLLTELHNYTLLDGNNEDSMKTGMWSPAWRKARKGDKYYLYNRLDNNLSTYKKLSIFLKNNYTNIPQLIILKIKTGFIDHGFGLLTFPMLLYYFLCFINKKKYLPNQESALISFPIIYFLSILIISVLAFGMKRHSLTIMPFLILPAIYSPCYLIKTVTKLIQK